MPTLSLTPTALEDPYLPDDMAVAEIADRIAIMQIQEETTYFVRDYLAETKSMRKMASKPVDEDCRIKMCEWCFQVVDFCKFRRETVVIGMSYLDRYLCTPKGKSALCHRKEYQLAAMTALYIAIKLHEPLEMETSLLADLSRGCYNEMEFVHMEQAMLQALKWRVNGPTPLGFVQHFVALLPTTVKKPVVDAIFDYARFQTEMSVSDHELVGVKPSEIALAAVLNAVEGLDEKLLPLKTQAKFYRNIEKFSEVSVAGVDYVQAKLSLLMASQITDDFEEIIDSTYRTEEDLESLEGTKGGLDRRTSPVSVIRRGQLA